MPFSDTHKLWPHTHINHVCNTCYHGNGNIDAFLSNSTTLHSNQLQTPHSNRAAMRWVPWHFGCATRPSSAVRLNVTAKEGLCGLNVKLLVDSTTDENVQYNPSWNCLGVVKINVPLCYKVQWNDSLHWSPFRCNGFQQIPQTHVYDLMGGEMVQSTDVICSTHDGWITISLKHWWHVTSCPLQGNASLHIQLAHIQHWMHTLGCTHILHTWHPWTCPLSVRGSNDSSLYTGQRTKLIVCGCHHWLCPTRPAGTDFQMITIDSHVLKH